MASEFNLRTEQRCQDTKPNYDILFYTHFTLNLIEILFVTVTSHFKAILLAAVLILLLFILYKSYCSPVFYKKEIPENSADAAHLNTIHRMSMFSDIGLKYPFLNQIIGKVTTNGARSGGEATRNIALIPQSQKYIIMKMDVFPLKVSGNQIGPAHVRLNLMSPLGPVMLCQSVTPLAPLLLRVVHRVYSPWYNAPLGAALVLLEAKQFQRDVILWNNKRYVASPAYTKNEKSIRAFRAWFSQFYSKDSVSMRDAMQNPLDW